MATPAATPSGAPSGSNLRWGRSGEPGSAFNGLSRLGRGRGRGGRVGRGGGRGHSSNRDPKPEDDIKSTKHENLPSSAPASAKPPALPVPSVPIPPPASENSTIPPPPPSSSKPKPSSRRASRTIPPPVNTQVQTADVPSAPSSAKPSGRRKRSTAGKAPASLPPKINPPASNRPNRPRVGPIPSSAPVKDTPPHLNQRFDMRNDIDALVERVRAVAMDNRPSTPGSHIDWAGDDDDSLPDLNDWGVNTATFGANKSEDTISPIIVGGLRPLPDIAPASVPNSPLKQVAEMAPPTSEDQKSAVPVAIPSLTKKIPPKDDARFNEAVTQIPVAQPVEPESETRAPSAKPITTQTTANAPPRKMLHPSLPAKPVNAPPTTPLKSRATATPMRNPPYPKTLTSANTDNFTGREPKPAPELDPLTYSSSAVDLEDTPEQANVAIIVEQLAQEVQDSIQKPNIPTDLTVVEPARSGSTSFLDPSRGDPATEYTQSAKASRISDDLVVAEGLSASMHAPKAMADSLSAPANMSSYSDSSGDRSGPSPTHTRAHTLGRPPSFPKPSHNDYNQRFTRSGHSTPRGGFQNQYHSRTHSTPPTGVHSNQHRPQNRPVITGDAISRLARTIGKTNVSPPKQTLATLGD